MPIDIKKVLPLETYRSLFVERMFEVLVEDYKAGFAKLSPSHRLVVGSYIEVTPAPPRVNLPE
jgi:hypothetical protein